MTARLLTALVALVVLAGCTATPAETVRLRVLASAELADMAPLLAELRAETGIELELDPRGTVDATESLTPGQYRHDLAWLSSDRHFQLKLRESGYAGPKPLSTSTMMSPVVLGLTRQAAEQLGSAPSWADIADRAAAGELRFAMGDPASTGSGLAALVGVATAAAGTGRALRTEDVACDRLSGFRVGHRLSADNSRDLVAEYLAHQSELDGLVTYESTLMTLNDSGRVAEPLRIVYPADGIVQADYPLLLLDPSKRAAYDRVVEWLRSAPVQQRIMDRTARRPVNPEVPRSPRLSAEPANSLYFPDEYQVIDTLLANYRTGPRQVIFALDFSGSMRGARMAALRTAFADLTGAGEAGFSRFHQGERLTVIRFGGRVIDQREFTIGGPADLAAVRDFVGVEAYDTSTAVWSAVDHAYDLAAQLGPGEVSVVVMTDGLSNTGITESELLARVRATRTPLFAVRFGEADPAASAGSGCPSRRRPSAQAPSTGRTRRPSAATWRRRSPPASSGWWCRRCNARATSSTSICVAAKSPVVVP
ncbi:substrate-binding domain-containing protein [Saccharopolyspora sp. 5N708]|uniref:substrate-binding domain-containing protein n=1 Tax=Saccharopolyspora sp. 5N708 TaxID=3457424 RepID=UPI003FD4E39B